jgi:hypothetical protein
MGSSELGADDPRALHVLGRAHLKEGRTAEAIATLERAVAAAPANAQMLLSLGSACRSQGDLGRASDAFQGAARLDPSLAAAWFNLGVVRRDQSLLRESILAFREAARLDPTDYDAHQNVVDTLAAAVRAGQAPFVEAPPPLSPQRTAVSIVVCSIDDAKLATFVERIEPHLAGREHEIVAIRDARSLAEGYRRGWKCSRHPIVVFCHDDFAILSADAFAYVEAALDKADIVGLAGSTRAAGPAVLWAGHPDIHGCVTHPARDGRGWETAVLSLRAGLIEGAQTLDGVFMAMRREVPARVGFDAATFDGFHFYDLDFSYRAARAGLKLAITTDVAAIHESTGTFDAAFERYAAIFRAKFPELSAPRGAHHWYAVRFEDAAHIVAFSRQLRALSEA